MVGCNHSSISLHLCQSLFLSASKRGTEESVGFKILEIEKPIFLKVKKKHDKRDDHKCRLVGYELTEANRMVTVKRTKNRGKPVGQCV